MITDNNDSPDYKSEKPLNERIKIRANGQPYVTVEAQVALLEKRRAASERARLERAVIDLAKKTRAKGVSASCPSEDCKAYYAAVDALLEFEQKQK